MPLPVFNGSATHEGKKLFEAAWEDVLLLRVKQQNNNNIVDVIITCQSRRKILYTVGLGFMLILGLQGLPGGPKNCIQPYGKIYNDVILYSPLPKCRTSAATSQRDYLIHHDIWGFVMNSQKSPVKWIESRGGPPDFWSDWYARSEQILDEYATSTVMIGT